MRVSHRVRLACCRLNVDMTLIVGDSSSDDRSTSDNWRLIFG
jgi:hypothetical protein